MTNEALPWPGFPPAVDLANTVMVTPAGELDLLEDEGQRRAWIAAERGRIVGVEAASGRLPEVRALREAVRELLHARERRAPSGESAAAGQRDLCLGAPQGRSDARGPGRRGARRAIPTPCSSRRSRARQLNSPIATRIGSLSARLRAAACSFCAITHGRSGARRPAATGRGSPVMPPGGGSAEAIHSRPTGGARPSHGEPDPIEPQRRSRSSTSPGRSPSRGVAPIARTGPTFDLCTPRVKPIANLTASLAGFGHDPLRERVRSGAAAVSFARSEAGEPNSTIGRMSS